MNDPRPNREHWRDASVDLESEDSKEANEDAVEKSSYEDGLERVLEKLRASEKGHYGRGRRG